MIKTAEEIAEIAEDLDGMSNIRRINKLYRAQDQSHLYPINGAYNVTEKAIRLARQQANANGAVYGYEYAMLLDYVIGSLVNSVDY